MYHIDTCTTSLVKGWIFDDNDPGKSLELALYVQNLHIASFFANKPRPALADIAGSIEHGFEFYLPDSLVENTSDVIRIQRADNSEVILEQPFSAPLASKSFVPQSKTVADDRVNNSIKKIRRALAGDFTRQSVKSFQEKFRDELAKGYWNISFLSINTDKIFIRVEGTLKCPAEVKGDCAIEIRSLADDKLHSSRVLSSTSGGDAFGFDVSFSELPLQLLMDSGFSLQIISASNGQPLFDHGARYYIVDSSPIPPGDNIKRIAGNASVVGYRLVGYSTFCNLEKILSEKLSTSYADYPRICDWGCGCGRLTRYLANVSGTQVAGLDIDAENVDWVAHNLADVHTRVIDTLPPTSINDNAFDLLIGISIFTHLTKERQNRWLDELKRLISPGGIALVTVNSDKAWLMNRPGNDDDFANYLEHGIIDNFANHDLDGVVESEDEYVNTFHTHEYIRNHWSRYFEIIDIVTGGLGGYQDVVILRNSA